MNGMTASTALAPKPASSVSTSSGREGARGRRPAKDRSLRGVGPFTAARPRALMAAALAVFVCWAPLHASGKPNKGKPEDKEAKKVMAEEKMAQKMMEQMVAEEGPPTQDANGAKDQQSGHSTQADKPGDKSSHRSDKTSDQGDKNEQASKSGGQTDKPAESAGAPSDKPSDKPSETAAVKPMVKSDFDPYRIVVDRNIFSPDRRKKQADTPKPPARDRIEVLGSLLSDEGTVAFFDGTKKEYQAARKVGESIAGFRVTDIKTEGVKLDKDGQQMDVPVGFELTRVGEAGPWTVAAAEPPKESRPEPAKVASAEDRPSDSSSHKKSSHSSKGDSSKSDGSKGADSASASHSNGGAAGGGSADNVLQQLMEKRRKELGQ